MLNFQDLKGKTLSHVAVTGSESITFTTTEGKRYILCHLQNCCESVYIESIVGDVTDLVGSPLLLAEVCTGETPADYHFVYEPESYTWTFYKLATIKGYVDIRWLGESNGYYSETVDFYEL
jgi:hypothetical protein